MANDIRAAIKLLIQTARVAHNAPDARQEDFTFRHRPDGQGVDAFRNWQGVTLPFAAEKKKAAE